MYTTYFNISELACTLVRVGHINLSVAWIWRQIKQADHFSLDMVSINNLTTTLNRHEYHQQLNPDSLIREFETLLLPLCASLL